MSSPDGSHNPAETSPSLTRQTSASSTPSINHPIKIGNVAQDFTQISSADVEQARKEEALLAYLLQLTNGQAALMLKAADEEQPPECQLSLFSPALGKWRNEAIEQGHKALDQAQRMDGSPARATPVELGGKSFTLLTSPVAGPEDRYLCIFILLENKDEIASFLIITQLATAFFRNNSLTPALPQTREAVDAWELDKTAAMVEVMARATREDDFDLATVQLANDLKDYFECYRVAVALNTLKGIQLEAISGMVEFDRGATTCVAIESAVREAVRQDQPVHYKAGEEEQGAAHSELARLLQLSEIRTIPCRQANGKISGVVILLWQKSSESSVSMEDWQSEALSSAAQEPLEGMLTAVNQRRPSPVKRYAIDQWKKWSPYKKKIAIGITIVLAFLLVIPMPHRLSNPCIVEPKVKRIIAAPYDGLLKRVIVEPGAIVKAKTILAELDGKEQTARLNELLARREQAQRRADQALSEGEVALHHIAQSEVDSINFEIEVQSDRTRNLKIKSPIEGYVIAGDLQRAEGIPLTKGQSLFEIAPLEWMIFEIEVAEHQISYINEGRPVYVKLNSGPGRTWEATVLRVARKSEIREGRNVFIAEAEIPNSEGILRPGMKGRAIIQSSPKPLIWQFTHRIWEAVQLFLFW